MKTKGTSVTVNTPNNQYTEIIHVNDFCTFGEIKREACRRWEISADATYIREHDHGGWGIRDEHVYMEEQCQSSFILEPFKPENRYEVQWASPYNQHISHRILCITFIVYFVVIMTVWYLF